MSEIKAGSSPDLAATYVYISLVDLNALQRIAADFERDWEEVRDDLKDMRQAAAYYATELEAAREKLRVLGYFDAVSGVTT